jgi:hypothetical protein
MFETFKEGCKNAQERKQLDLVVQLILAVLEFESNAPLYLYWYNAPQTFDQSLMDVVKALGLPPEGANTEEKVLKDFEDYLDDLAKRYPESNPRKARTGQQAVPAT